MDKKKFAYIKPCSFLQNTDNKNYPVHPRGQHNSGPFACNYIHYKVWDEITYQFLNFNGCTIEV